jgi:rod shape-determining protein MreC
MDHLLNRYRNILALLVAILAQLVLLGYQVKSNQDVQFIRVWTMTAVTPLAKGVESLRSGAVRFGQNYFSLRDMRAENERIRVDLDRLKLENQFLRNELATADRVRALAAFEQKSPSKLAAARVIGVAGGTTSKVVLIDRGSLAKVEKGMAVITPDGIVGKVIAVFPTASQVLLVTDAGFAAGVISQKNRVRGILKGNGHNSCRVDYVKNEQKVEPGEAFFTSGDDRVFPKGLPVGAAKLVRQGNQFAEISIEPAGMRNGLEEVLVVLEGTHEAIPEPGAASAQIFLMPQAPADPAQAPTPPAGAGTEADRLLDRYKTLGETQNHRFGENPPGSRAVDFNQKLEPAAAKPQ